MKKITFFGIFVLATVLIFLAAGLVLAQRPDDGLLGRPPIRPDQRTAEPTLVEGLDPAVHLPVLYGLPPSSGWVDTQNRAASRDYYLNVYLASNGVPNGWTGNHAGCDAGTTTVAFREAILLRINYFRAMAGLPPVTAFKAEYNMKAQEAALMMSVNGQLDHSPPPSWLCYTAAGAEGAGASNLYLGVYGPGAVTGYIADRGGGNYFVGHRRWILYPQSQFLGTGDIPPSPGYSAANALWVFDRDNMWGPRPQTREPYVAWPPPGYSPYQVVFPRWSFAYAGADFSAAVVTMTRNGQPLALQQNSVLNGFGENTLVWEPADTFGQAPGTDVTYSVAISNVSIDGQMQNFAYQVIIFEP